MQKSWLIIIVFLLVCSIAYSAKIDSVVEQKLDVQENINVVVIYKNSSWESQIVDGDELDDLSVNINVGSVVYDYPIIAYLQDSVGIVNASLVHLKQINGFNLTGDYETACVIDTGVNASHPALNNSVLYQACFCSSIEGGNSSCCPNGNSEQLGGDIGDNQGHGTHISGIIASAIGVAPGSKIVSVKVLNSSGYGLMSNLVSAINFCVSNKSVYNISVITGSLGTTNLFSDYCDDAAGLELVKNAVNNAIGNNISVVFATGNAGNSSAISAPSCMSNATSVAASTKSDEIASYSNRNNITDLVAPGSLINSTCYSGGYCIDSGTSMAAPHVAAGILLLREYKHLFGVNLTNLEIESALKNNGVNITDPESGLNFSRLNILAGLEAIDDEAPLLNLTSPANTTYNYNVSLPLNYSAEDAFLDSVFYSLDNTNNVSINSSSYVNVSSDGLHNLTIYSNDSKSHLNSSIVYFSVDTSVPSLVLLYPENNINYTSVNLNLNFSVGVSAYSCLYSLDGANTSITCSNSSLASLGQGHHNLTLYALNYFNQSNLSSISFDVDSVAPSISFGTGTLSNNSYSNSSNFIFVNLTINDSNIGNVTYNLFNSTSLVNRTNFSLWTGNTGINFTNLGMNSIYYYNASAYDSFSNYNYTETRKMTFDNVIPSITNITVTNSSNRLILYVTTNENAYCRYSTSNVVYSNMTAMSSTGGTSHSNSKTCSSSQSGTYYVRCKDYAENTMTTSNSVDYEITVSSSGVSGSSSGSSSSSNDDSVSTSSNKSSAAKTNAGKSSKTDLGNLTKTLSAVFVNFSQSNLTGISNVLFARNYSVVNDKTMITGSFTLNESVQTLIIYEKIPKSIAKNISNVTFADGLNYAVVREDPEVAMVFFNTSNGTKIEYNYSVGKNITGYDFFDYVDPMFFKTNNELNKTGSVMKQGVSGSFYYTLAYLCVFLLLFAVLIASIVIIFRARKRLLSSKKK